MIHLCHIWSKISPIVIVRGYCLEKLKTFCSSKNIVFLSLITKIVNLFWSTLLINFDNKVDFFIYINLTFEKFLFILFNRFTRQNLLWLEFIKKLKSKNTDTVAKVGLKSIKHETIKSKKKTIEKIKFRIQEILIAFSLEI